jgi:hypothetical protein
MQRGAHQDVLRIELGAQIARESVHELSRRFEHELVMPHEPSVCAA